MQHEYSSRGFFEYEGESSELKVFRLCNLHLVCASKLKLGAVLVNEYKQSIIQYTAEYFGNDIHKVDSTVIIRIMFSLGFPAL